MKNIFDFKTYLLDNDFIQSTPKFFVKNYITIKIIGNRFIALNTDNSIKHKHIVTSKQPTTLDEATIIFESCGIISLIKDTI